LHRLVELDGTLRERLSEPASGDTSIDVGELFRIEYVFEQRGLRRSDMRGVRGTREIGDELVE
jgi:hypothetical protein